MNRHLPPSPTLLVIALAVWAAMGCESRASSENADSSTRDVGAENTLDDARDERDAEPRGEDVVSEDAAMVSEDIMPPKDRPTADLPTSVDDEDAPCGEFLVSPETAFDAGPGATPCTPGRSVSCRCGTGGAGLQICDWNGRMGPCVCIDRPVLPSIDPDAGIVVYPDASTALPPRLIRPLSGMRVMSQRPSLRWELPAGLTRTRVELCEDRACTRHITQTEVMESSWRSPSPLRPGVIFWRVLGLRDDGSTAWTSATWEFGVRHRDTPTDTIGGPIKDFDGDGYDDALASVGSTSVLVIRGAPGGAHRRPAPIFEHPTTNFGLVSTVADFNGDGLTDAAIRDEDPARFYPAEPEDSYARIFHGNSACPMIEAGTIRSPLFLRDVYVGNGLVGGDFNGDGFGDLVATGVDVVTLYLGSAEGLPRAPWSQVAVGHLYASASAPPAYAMGDLDGDGYGDVIVGNYGASDGDGEVYIFYGNPVGRLEARVQRIASPEGGQFGQASMVGDFDGDGLSDLVVMRFDSRVFYYYRGSTQGARFAQRVVAPSAGGTPEPPGDFDGDGVVDLPLRGSGLIYRSRGASHFREDPGAEVWTFMIAPGWNAGADVLSSPGDLDGDGDDDLFSYGISPLTDYPRGALHLFRGAHVGVEPPVATWLSYLVRWVR